MLNRTISTPAMPRPYEAGSLIFLAHTSGNAWRIERGAIRLDRVDEHDEQSLASVAVQGDIIGAETLLLGIYAFSATALTPCLLSPWPPGTATATDSLLSTLVGTEKRAAEVFSLRTGEAQERVQRLLRLLSFREDKKTSVILPPRRDMAEITALTVETVSRVLSRLRQAGRLTPTRLQGIRANCAYVLAVGHNTP